MSELIEKLAQIRADALNAEEENEMKENEKFFTWLDKILLEDSDESKNIKEYLISSASTKDNASIYIRHTKEETLSILVPNDIILPSSRECRDIIQRKFSNKIGKCSVDIPVDRFNRTVFRITFDWSLSVPQKRKKIT